jgi:DNA modification methylase
MSDVTDLYLNPLPSARSGPLYNAFPYPTKISPEAIAIFIATHTKPGDTILDTFGGSGTTGIATLLCDKPTEKMLALSSEMSLRPVWGPRKATLYEIGSIAAFASDVMTSPPKPNDFLSAANALIEAAEEDHGWIWKTENSDGSLSEIRHTIWSDVLCCPICKAEATYWDTCVEFDPLKLKKNFVCAGCDKHIAVNECDRAIEEYWDQLLEKTCTRRKRIAVRIHGSSGRTKWQSDPSQFDIDLVHKIAKLKLPVDSPVWEMVWGDLYRSGYHFGISHAHQFYTTRSFYCIARLWELIGNYPKELQPALKLLVLSYNASHSTLMTRIVVKKGQSDFALTSAQSGVLYISGLPVEKNILAGLRRKLTTFYDAFNITYGTKSSVTVVNASSDNMDLEDESIDYVFTDPPFGGYIPYAEISQINEMWLGRKTEMKKEIIISKSQNKDAVTYGNMLGEVFSEISRVLKSSGSATLVFHSAHSEVWQQLQKAYLSSGLKVTDTSVLDKLQSSFKQTAARVAVRGDPIIRLVKNVGFRDDESPPIDDLINQLIHDAKTSKNSIDESKPERLYSRFVGKCLERGLPVAMNADAFYSHLKTLNTEPV